MRDGRDLTRMPLRTELAVLPADAPGREIGFTMYERVGSVLWNARHLRLPERPCPDCGDVPSDESAGWCRSCEALLVLRG